MTKLIRRLSACALAVALLLGGCTRSYEPPPEDVPNIPAGKKDSAKLGMGGVEQPPPGTGAGAPAPDVED